MTQACAAHSKNNCNEFKKGRRASRSPALNNLSMSIKSISCTIVCLRQHYNTNLVETH